MGTWALGSQGDWAVTGTSSSAWRHNVYIQSGKSGPMEDSSIFRSWLANICFHS